MRFVGFIGPSYTLSSVNVDCQRCVNLYPEVNELNSGKSKEVASLIGTPGLSLLQTVGDGPIRGMWYTSTGRLFVVSKSTLYELSSSFVATSRGTINTSSGSVSLADNGIQLVLVDGTDGFSLTLADNTFAEITDEDFLGADFVVYLDGYFIFNKPDSGQFFISELNGVTIEPDIATSEGSPDKIVSLLADHRDLWIFNEKTIEVFFNSGNADFPFERIQGAFIEHGCAAAFSVAKMANTVYWLGQDESGKGTVYMASGYNPQRISTHAIEHAINGYGDLTNTRGFCYQQSGHFFYQLNFENAETSWVFDATTNLWHERAYFSEGNFERHRAECHAFAFGKHVVGDYENGKLYELKEDTYSDAGDEIIRMRVSPHIDEEMKRIMHHRFQLEAEVGVGLDGSGQGIDPQVMLQWSDDGGHSWSNEHWTSLGKIGQRTKRAIWNRLGQSRDRVYRVMISDPVKVRLIGAELDVTKAAS